MSSGDTLWDLSRDKTIDSRDLVLRVDELEELVADETATLDEREELDLLHGLINDIEGYSGSARSGVTLIADEYFEEYAQQFAEEIGALDGRYSRWPFEHIDWKAAAEALQMDYTSVNIGTTEYWFR